jgi:hypothetical protein
MKSFVHNARFILCGLIILAFFLPAYQGISGFSYIPFAFSTLEGQNEITETDIWVTIIPLVLIPITVVVILFRAYMRLSTRKTVMFLPALCFAFFTIILFVSQKSGGASFSGRAVLFEMTIGFYLMALGCAFLPFTKTPRKRKAVKRVEEMEVAL